MRKLILGEFGNVHYGFTYKEVKKKGLMLSECTRIFLKFNQYLFSRIYVQLTVR